MLFDRAPEFRGLPRSGFEAFSIGERETRRRAIIETFHPSLSALGEDLVARLGPHAAEPLHIHLPRLDWPRGYQPFCTWLALSRETQGYQGGAQLNVGVHRDHVALRLGWDTSADAFGRFEFLCRHGELGAELLAAASRHQLAFRVFAAAPWPVGSELVFESRADLSSSFAEVRRRGVWWELGRRHRFPDSLEHVCSPELGTEAAELFIGLLPAYDRIAGHATPGPQ